MAALAVSDVVLERFRSTQQPELFKILEDAGSSDMAIESLIWAAQ